MNIRINKFISLGIFFLLIALYSCEDKGGIEIVTITFDSNGGTEVPNKSISKGSTVTKPDSPTRPNGIFIDWFTDLSNSEPFGFGTTKVDSNLTLIAKWTLEKNTITFDSRGGSMVADIEVESGKNPNAPTPPSREGYDFVAWHSVEGLKFKPGNIYRFATELLAGDITLYAEWGGDNIKRIGDAKFRESLAPLVGEAFQGESIDTKHPSLLDVDKLNLSQKGISSLDGIQYFTELTELLCNNNKLSSELDVSALTKLVTLNCRQNELTAINTSGCVELLTLDAQANKLQSQNINFSLNPKLKSLNIKQNEIEYIDLRTNVDLESFNCVSNRIVNLIMNKHPKLSSLSCNQPTLASLDIRNSPLITDLHINDDGITSPNLTTLSIDNTIICHDTIKTFVDASSIPISIKAYSNNGTQLTNYNKSNYSGVGCSN